MYSLNTSINASGNKTALLQTQPWLPAWNFLRFSSPMQNFGWQCRQGIGSMQAHSLPVQVLQNYATAGSTLTPNVVFGRPRFPSALLPLYQVNRSGVNFCQNLHPQTQRLSAPSYAVGAGDALMTNNQVRTLSTAPNCLCHNTENSEIGNCSAWKREIKKEILTPWLKAQVEEKLRKKLCVLASENASDTSSSNAANTSNLFQNTLDKFLMKIVELFNKLNIKDSSSASQRKTSINNLLMESRQYFYTLESSAICAILKENNHWNKDSNIAEMFHHEFFSMADIISVYLLQLILAYNECGFVSIDPSGSDPLSILSFYRGEFRLGRVLPGVYHMHIISYQYTTCTNLLVKEGPCPMRKLETRKCMWTSNGDIQADVLHWQSCKYCDPFHAVGSKVGCRNDVIGSGDIRVCSSKFVEDPTKLLKMLRWRVRYMQIPNVEEESYYLCCKAVKPYLNEPEFIFQSDSFQFFLGKLESPKINFTNPSIDEIDLECRPSAGYFKVLHSFGHQLPIYSAAVGILVDYLRHIRFERTVF